MDTIVEDKHDKISKQDLRKITQMWYLNDLAYIFCILLILEQPTHSGSTIGARQLNLVPLQLIFSTPKPINILSPIDMHNIWNLFDFSQSCYTSLVWYMNILLVKIKPENLIIYYFQWSSGQ